VRLTRLGGACPDGNTCPAMFATDEETVIVQGRRVAEETLGMLRLGEDEYAVEVPMELLRKVAAQC
jgi:hypothetical protein